MKLKIKTSEDGSHTILNEDINESYHSSFGAFTESMHIFIKNGFLHKSTNELKILEVGFGTGLNAFLTLIEAEKKQIKTFYESIELYPVEDKIIDVLNYIEFVENDYANFFPILHKTSWEMEAKITAHFYLKKMKQDLLKFEPKQLYDVVYFDAFSPEKQPELWHFEIFCKLYNNMKPKAVLVAYCVKGTVKRALRDAGFKIEILNGPPGKRHILRALK